MAGDNAGGTTSEFMKMGKMMGQSNNPSNSGMYDGLDKVTEKLMANKLARQAEVKGERESLRKERKLAGQKLTNEFTEMGPTLKVLGPESFGQAQTEIEGLRQQMFEAIDAGDQKKIAELNMKLNDIKTRHSGDAENLTTLIDSWESDTVSTDAMTKENIDVLTNFAANKTKKEVYVENEDGVPELRYEWDTEEPLLDETTGEQQIDEEGNPMFVKDQKSLAEMQDMLVTKDTVNGNKMLDLGQELKVCYKDKSPMSDADIKHKVGEIIPQDPKAIRDWLHGNPAEFPGLNVHDYLNDLMNTDYGTFDKLGIDLTKPEYAHLDKDKEGDDGYGTVEADEVPEAFREELINNVLDVKDLEVSHGIITEIYSSLMKNNMMGISNEDQRDPSETTILGNKESSSAKASNDANETLEKLKSLGDPDSPIHAEIARMNEAQIATHILGSGAKWTDEVYDPVTKEKITLAKYIADAKNKKSKPNEQNPKDPMAGMTAAQKIQYIKDNK